MGVRAGHWEHGTKGPGAAPKLREGSGELLSCRGEERNTGEHIHPAQNLSHPHISVTQKICKEGQKVGYSKMRVQTLDYIVIQVMNPIYILDNRPGRVGLCIWLLKEEDSLGAGSTDVSPL